MNAEELNRARPSIGFSRELTGSQLLRNLLSIADGWFRAP